MNAWLNIIQIMLASQEVGISHELVYSVCHTETRIRNVINKHDGGSPSYGICQVKLKTAKQFFPKWTAKDLMIPYNNAKAAATYLKWQMGRFKGLSKGVSAYNAGRPIKSNKKYVNKVLTTLASI